MKKSKYTTTPVNINSHLVSSKTKSKESVVKNPSHLFEVESTHLPDNMLLCITGSGKNGTFSLPTPVGKIEGSFSIDDNFQCL